MEVPLEKLTELLAALVLATSAAMLTLTIIACTCWAMHSRWLRAYLQDLYTQLGNRPTATPSMHYTVSIHDPNRIKEVNLTNPETLEINAFCGLSELFEMDNIMLGPPEALSMEKELYLSHLFNATGKQDSQLVEGEKIVAICCDPIGNINFEHVIQAVSTTSIKDGSYRTSIVEKDNGTEILRTRSLGTSPGQVNLQHQVHSLHWAFCHSFLIHITDI